ncbi:hypothetical protein F9C11_31535 [Amycolatopsis sp. VS8301801F10]
MTVVLPAVGSSRTKPVTPTARLYQVSVPPVRPPLISPPKSDVG